MRMSPTMIALMAPDFMYDDTLGPLRDKPTIASGLEINH